MSKKLSVALVLFLAAFVSLPGQVTKFTDPAGLPHDAVALAFGESPPNAQGGDLFRAAGVRFRGEGGAIPTVELVVLAPSIPPLTTRALRNVEPEPPRSESALLILFDFPVRRVGLTLSNGDPSTVATLEAFSPGAVALGSVQQDGIDSNQGRFVGVETSHPEGIATLRLSYGDGPEERLHNLRFELLDPRPFVVFLPQVASGTAGSLRIEMTVQVQNLVGGSDSTSLEFLDDQGRPLPLTVDGETVSALEFGLRGAAGRVLRIGGAGPIQSGYARIASDQPVLAQAIYQVYRDGVLLSEAGVDSTPARVVQVLTFEREAAGGLDMGIAISNPGGEENLVTFTLFDLDEAPRSAQSQIRLQPGEHRSFFIGEMFESIGEGSFRGSLLILSGWPVTATGLRTRFGLPSASLATGGTQF